MRIGLSLLTGEHVAATGLGYDDVAARQIVCPACKEALVKAKTTHKAGVTEYLRHRQRPKTEIEREEQGRCELRVFAIQRDIEAKARPFQPRGQTIESFMEAFATMLDMASRTNKQMVLDDDGWEGSATSMEPHARCLRMLEQRRTQRRSQNDREIEEILAPDSRLRRNPIDEALPAEAVERHYAMVRDIWQHANTASVQDNMRRLLLAGCAAAMDQARFTLSSMIHEDIGPLDAANPDAFAVMALEHYCGDYVDSARSGLLASDRRNTPFLLAAAWLGTLLDGSQDMRISINRKRLLKSHLGTLTTTSLDDAAWGAILYYCAKLLRVMVVLADDEHRRVLLKSWTIVDEHGQERTLSPDATEAEVTGRTPTSPRSASEEPDTATAPTAALGPAPTRPDPVRRALEKPAQYGIPIPLDDGTWATVSLSAEEIRDALDRRSNDGTR